jgi:hypothetical protein
VVDVKLLNQTSKDLQMMDTIKEYLSTPWIIAVALLVLVVIIVAIMISKKEGYY